MSPRPTPPCDEIAKELGCISSATRPNPKPTTAGNGCVNPTLQLPIHQRGLCFRPVPRLLACPFCRELYRDDEAVEICPECDLRLRPLASLPPSFETRAEPATSAPSDVPLHWTHWRDGRGAFLIIGALGLAAFFLPWIAMTKPEIGTLNGFALARYAAPWLWAGPVAWFVSLPLVFTRRTLRALSGVRLVCGMFAAMTLVDLALLLTVPASGSSRVPVQFTFAWGVWSSAALSIIGILVASRLGGTTRKPISLAEADVRTPRHVVPAGDSTLH